MRRRATVAAGTIGAVTVAAVEDTAADAGETTIVAAVAVTAGDVDVTTTGVAVAVTEAGATAMTAINPTP